jgi:hypothetical protein
MGKISKQARSNRSNLGKAFKAKIEKKTVHLTNFISPEIMANHKSDPDFIFIEKEFYELKEVGTDLISDIVEFILDNGASYRTIGVLIISILKYLFS